MLAPTQHLAGILGQGGQTAAPQFGPVAAAPMPAMHRQQMMPLQAQPVSAPQVPQTRQAQPSPAPEGDPMFRPESAAPMQQPITHQTPNLQPVDTGRVAPVGQGAQPSFMDLMNMTAGGWSPLANLGFPIF